MLSLSLSVFPPKPRPVHPPARDVLHLQRHPRQARPVRVGAHCPWLNLVCRISTADACAGCFLPALLPSHRSFRPTLAGLVEEALLDKLEAIAGALEASPEGRAWGWRVEGWEVARKDGWVVVREEGREMNRRLMMRDWERNAHRGIFLDFSYVPLPAATAPVSGTSESGDSGSAAPTTLASASRCTAHLLVLLADTAKAHGGFPSWLGKWYADWIGGTPSGGAAASGAGKIPGESEGEAEAEAEVQAGAVTEVAATARPARSPGLGRRETDAGVEVRDGDGRRVTGRVGSRGGGRLWVVRGRQWTEVRPCEERSKGECEIFGGLLMRRRAGTGHEPLSILAAARRIRWTRRVARGAV